MVGTGKLRLPSGRGPVVALLLLSAAGAFWGFRRRDGGAKPGESAERAAVSRGDLEVHFADSGELWPKDRVDVASKVSGRVTQLSVEEGGRVRKGERLAVIQPGRSEAEKYLPFEVSSPLDGVVMRYQKEGSNEEARIARLGDYVTGLLESNSPTYLMSVADMRRLIVRMRISEMDILKLREGMDVAVIVDALPQETFPGRVSLISPQAEKDQNNLKNFRVEVSLSRLDPRLKPGMTARVDGLLEARKGVLKIPLSAVFEEAGREVAYVLKAPKSEPERTEVKLGLRNELEAELHTGLPEGAELLTEKPAEPLKEQGGGRGSRRARAR